MRRTQRHSVQGSNSLWQVYRTVPFLKVLKNVIINALARVMPSFRLKNWLYRVFLGMEVGDKTAVAYLVMMDILFPEYIHIGKNCVIGYNTTILAHEYLIDEYRVGRVIIGDEVMIGANTTILPGVYIGDRAVVAAGSVVHKDVPPGSFVGGNPLRVIRSPYEQVTRYDGQPGNGLIQ